MKPKNIFALALCLILATGVLSSACAAGESYDVSALETGYHNVPFSNGYNGFCIDYALLSPLRGNRFMELDTTHATSNLNGSQIGEYLKILFVKNADTYFNKNADGNIVLDDPTKFLSHLHWSFSDMDYQSSPAFVATQKAVQLKENGMTIPDKGMEPILLDGNTWITFEFMVLRPDSESVSSMFAYKINTLNGYTPPQIPPVTPPSAPPASGDATPLALWAALAGMSFAGMVCLTKCKRRVN